jgi:hypothetical protein
MVVVMTGVSARPGVEVDRSRCWPRRGSDAGIAGNGHQRQRGPLVSQDFPTGPEQRVVPFHGSREAGDRLAPERYRQTQTEVERDGRGLAAGPGTAQPLEPRPRGGDRATHPPARSVAADAGGGFLPPADHSAISAAAGSRTQEK